MRFTIYDYEISKTSVVEAPGFIEAMLEYLPWPSLQLHCDYKPTHGTAIFTDDKTDFKYEVRQT